MLQPGKYLLFTLLGAAIFQHAHADEMRVSAACKVEASSAAAAASPNKPLISVAAAKCGTKNTCKIDDDLTIPLMPQPAADTAAADTKIRFALGSFVKANDPGNPPCETKLSLADFRKGTAANERAISMAALVGDRPGTALSDVLQLATAQFDTNRAPFYIEEAKCRNPGGCQFARTLELTVPHLLDCLSATKKDAQKLTLMLNGRLILDLDVYPICDHVPPADAGRQGPLAIDTGPLAN